MRSLICRQTLFFLPALVLLSLSGGTSRIQAQCNPSTSMNWNGTLGKFTSTSITNVAIQANSGAKPQIICSIELFMRAKVVSQTLSITIWDAKGPWGGGKVIGSSTMFVPTQPQACRAWFAPSLIIPPNTGYWIEYNKATNLIWPIMTSGTTVTHYRFYRSAWGPITKWPWNYRIHTGKATKASYNTFGSGCPGSSAPLLMTSGRPVLDQTFQVDLSKAPPSSPVIFILGFSNQVWGSFKLPFDLTLMGAPGCPLHVSPNLLLVTTSNQSGKAQVDLAVPNGISLMGKMFYNQFVVYDPKANALGLVVSNAGAATIGI